MQRWSERRNLATNVAGSGRVGRLSLMSQAGKEVIEVGATEDRNDARLSGRYRDAFRLSMVILKRKGSKRLIALEVEEALNDLEVLEETWRLPAHFWDLSCYGQRQALENVERELREAGVI